MSPLADGSFPEGRVEVSVPGMGLRMPTFLAYRCWRNVYSEVTTKRRFRQVMQAGYKRRGPKPKEQRNG